MKQLQDMDWLKFAEFIDEEDTPPSSPEPAKDKAPEPAKPLAPAAPLVPAPPLAPAAPLAPAPPLAPKPPSEDRLLNRPKATPTLLRNTQSDSDRVVEESMGALEPQPPTRRERPRAAHPKRRSKPQPLPPECFVNDARRKTSECMFPEIKGASSRTPTPRGFSPPTMRSPSPTNDELLDLLLAEGTSSFQDPREREAEMQGLLRHLEKLRRSPEVVTFNPRPPVQPVPEIIPNSVRFNRRVISPSPLRRAERIDAITLHRQQIALNREHAARVAAQEAEERRRREAEEAEQRRLLRENEERLAREQAERDARRVREFTARAAMMQREWNLRRAASWYEPIRDAIASRQLHIREYSPGFVARMREINSFGPEDLVYPANGGPAALPPGHLPHPPAAPVAHHPHPPAAPVVHHPHPPAAPVAHHPHPPAAPVAHRPHPPVPPVVLAAQANAAPPAPEDMVQEIAINVQPNSSHAHGHGNAQLNNNGVPAGAQQPVNGHVQNIGTAEVLTIHPSHLPHLPAPPRTSRNANGGRPRRGRNNGWVG